MPKILNNSPLITFKSIELLKVEEEHTEPMVESAHISHLKLISKCGPLKRQLTSEEKEKPDKLPREKSQSVKLNDSHLFKYLIFIYQLNLNKNQLKNT